MTGDPDALKIMTDLHPVILAAKAAGYPFRLTTDSVTVSLTITVKERYGPALSAPPEPNTPAQAGEG